MTLKTQKIISAVLVFLAVSLSFAALAAIVNLNQLKIFLQVAIVVWLYIWLTIAVLYDLHFKKTRQSVQPLRAWTDAVYERCEHLLRWKHYSQALHFLLLPAFIFWATVILLYVEMGHRPMQYIFISLSTIALVVDYMYIKEAFLRKEEKISQDIFVALSVIKIYSIAMLFAATMAIMRMFCLEPNLFVTAMVCLVFLHIYQALYQHKLINVKNIAITLGIAALLGLVSYHIYIYWSYNFVTAAIFFAVIYNLTWGIYHYYLDHVLTREVLVEIVLVCALIAYIVLSVTNFRGQILEGCPFLR